MLAIGALFLALAGTAIAAGEIITSPDQIKDGVVTGPKLADDAVNSRTLADSSVGLEHLKRPVVAAGVNEGLTLGDQPFLINPTSEVLSVEGPPSGAPNQGSYTIRFGSPVRHCQWTATPADTDVPGVPRKPTFIHVKPSKFDQREVFVFTSELKTVGSNKGSVISEPASFYLLGRC
jgi:hypothetical protein